MDSKEIEKLQIDLDCLGDWVVENDMKINPGKIKAVNFMKTRVKDPLTYSFGAKKFQKQATLNTLELSYAET
jgi:hypothetical protein